MDTWSHDSLEVQVAGMTADELKKYLTQELKFSCDDMEKLRERCVDGCAFMNLSREDIGVIFPNPAQFIMASKLYKVVQRVRLHSSSNTQELLEELSELAHTHPSLSDVRSSAGSSKSLSSQSSSTTPRFRKRPAPSLSTSCKRNKISDSFVLPFFSPDIQQCIKRDAFYTNAQRNKLIKEACTSLRGFCCEKGEAVSSERKRDLAKALLALAPKSLRDPSRKELCASPEAGLYGQIVKWFQNHSYLDRKASGEVQVRQKMVAKGSEDDDTAVTEHLSELVKESSRKKVTDRDKVVRLLSLTHQARQKEMAECIATSRVSFTIAKYGVLQSPSYLVEEMLLILGRRFENFEDLTKSVIHVQERWVRKLVPAILAYAEELGKPPPEDDERNTLPLYCVEFIVRTLKLKGAKPSYEERLSAIIVFAKTVDEGLTKTKGNTNPYILCVGTPSTITSNVIICNGAVVTRHIGGCVLGSIVVLLAVHYCYNLEYNKKVKGVLEFLQEKLLADHLPTSRKTSASYDQLYRALDCLERKIEEEVEDDNVVDEDCTQLEYVYD